MKPISDVGLLLASMTPVLVKGTFVYAMVTDLRGIELNDILCVFRESEGLSLICTQEYADRAGLRYEGCFRQIKLAVYSSLHAVGFLAAVSEALAQAGIPCNAVSAFSHDYLFVPDENASQAIDILRGLSKVSSDSNQALLPTCTVAMPAADSPVTPPPATAYP